jgi:hypothetical protein
MPRPHRSSTIKTQETRAVQPMDDPHQVPASKQAVQRCRNSRKSQGKPHVSEEPVSKAMHRCRAKRPFPNAICKMQGMKAVDVRSKLSLNKQLERCRKSRQSKAGLHESEEPVPSARIQQMEQCAKLQLLTQVLLSSTHFCEDIHKPRFCSRRRQYQ